MMLESDFMYLNPIKPNIYLNGQNVGAESMVEMFHLDYYSLWF